MILSSAHRFIFIKGVKVAGTSVEIALSAICGPEDIVCPITPRDELMRLEIDAGARNYSENRAAELAYLDSLRQAAMSDLTGFRMPASVYFNHMSLREVLRLQGPDVLECRVACVERHPYAKIISWANHMMSFGSYQISGEMRSDLRKVKDYLDTAVEDGSIAAVRNIDRYRQMDGIILAHVMRYENLNSDFQRFVSILGIEDCPQLPHAKKGILANSLDPRDFFDKRQISVINEIFREEFETFQYEPL
jgi:hypothetical protein